MKLKSLLLLLLVMSLFGAFPSGLNAQQTYNCSIPNSNNHPPGTIGCAGSCIHCSIDGFQDVNNQTLPAPFSTFCLNLETPRWYGFIAGSTSIQFQIKPSTTTNGNGLEAMITSACSDIISCTQGHTGGGLMPVNVFVSNLIIGNAYQLCIDGYQGDICNYTINVVSGSTIGPGVGPIGTIQGIKQVCPNATVTYTIPAVDYAIAYKWTAPPGSTINGGTTNVLSVPAPGGTSVQIKFGSVGGTVCVEASNPCSNAISTCINVTNKAIPIVDLPPLRICNESLPFVWDEAPNNFLIAPGTYTLTSTPIASFLGCDSIVRQKITILPVKIKNLAPIYLCKGQCFSINGNKYCDSGTFAETLGTADGCDSLVNFTLHIVPVKAVIQKPDTVTCAVPSVTLTSVGSTTGNTVTYHWTNSNWQVISTTSTATATAADTIYHLIVANFMGGVSCYDTATVKVPHLTTIPYVNAGPSKELGCVPQINLQGTASQGSQYGYLWVASAGGNIVSGSTTLTPAVNAPGTYKLYVTNNHTGCTAVSTTHVTEMVTPPTISATGGKITCKDSTVVLHTVSTPDMLAFAWTGPNGFTSSSANPTVSASGTYTIVVTDATNGCTATSTATVTIEKVLPGAIATGGMLTCIQDSVILNGTSATTGVQYAWTGPNGFADTLSNPTVKTAGDYNLVITSTNGCTSTAIATVILNNTLPGATLAASGNLNCNNASINLLSSSTANPANLDHAWTLPDNSKDNTGTGTLLVASVPGVYKLVITNTINGCTSTAAVSVVKHEPVTSTITAQSNITCFGANNGQLSVVAAGGDLNYTNLWSNTTTGTAVSNLGSGTYTVTVSDSENCSATATATVTQPTQLLANTAATPQTGVGLTDGTATVNPTGGTPAYTYLWSNGQTTQSISDLEPGLYTVTITDQNGCTDLQTANVNPYNCTAQAAVVAQNVGCHGQANGTAAINISGGTKPFVYNWSNGATTASASDLLPGFYSVSITDSANCVVAVSFTLLQPDTLLANVSNTQSSGPTTNNGTATANPTGGSGSYTYSWSTGASTASISNLAGGTYTVTVTDTKGCIAVQNTVITVGHCGVINSFIVNNPLCNGGGGTATVVLTGGFPPFTYSWSSGGTNNPETGLHAGTYAVSFTDVKGCQIVDSISLTEPALLTATVGTVSNTICKNDPQGAIDLTAAGGTGTPTVLWSNGQTQFSIANLLPASYTATVTDANGCTTTATAQVQFTDAVAPTIQVAAIDTVNLGSSGSITLTAQNLNATITDNCEVATVTVTPNKYNCNDIGNHQVTITATDASGNSKSQTITVKIVDTTPPTLACPPSVIRCFGDDIVSYNAPTALDNCLALGGTFQLTSGLESGSTFPPGTTTTTYSFTDSQGNIGTCSFDVTVLTQMKLKVDTVINDINNQHIGSIHVTATGSLAPYHFVWTENGNPIPDSTQQLVGIGQGDYHLVVTDVYGCSVQSTTIHVTSITATTNPGYIPEVGIYPNPTTGNLTIVLPDELTDRSAQLSVYDQTGRKVSEQVSNQTKQIKMDLSKLATGVYYLRVQVGENQVIKKVVVDR
jgi:hypothetical protein